MPYGPSARLLIGKNASGASEALSRSPSAWRALDPTSRLALVEQALTTPANDDSPDGYSLAL